MACLQHLPLPSVRQKFLSTSTFSSQSAVRKNESCRDGMAMSVQVRAELGSSSLSVAAPQVVPEATGRRQMLAVGAIIPSVLLLDHSVSFAAESKKGFLPVMDKKDGYTFYYPFGWQEVAIEGQDKVFKDVIEPLESVSINVIPTSKQDIRDFGPPQEVAETLIKKVLAPPSQKTKLIQAKEQEVEGTAYYTFEFISQAPNFTRHALSTVCVGNGKFYTLTTGANERRWNKMKDRLETVAESFRVFNVV